MKSQKKVLPDFQESEQSALIKARVKEDKEIVKESVKEPVKEVLKEEKKFVKETAKVSNVDATEVEEAAKKFLGEVFDAMEMEVIVDAKYDDAEKALDVDMRGEEIGILIGKRGQTLDSLQYLVSLVVNRGQADYIRVKLDTENYRQRRKETLEKEKAVTSVTAFGYVRKINPR